MKYRLKVILIKRYQTVTFAFHLFEAAFIAFAFHFFEAAFIAFAFYFFEAAFIAFGIVYVFKKSIIHVVYYRLRFRESL